MPRKPYTAPATPPERKLFLTVSEVAQVLGIGPVNVCRIIKRGELPAAFVGRGYLIRRADIDRYIESRLHIRAKIAA
jgi:excisionase family DNA binding protein